MIAAVAVLLAAGRAESQGIKGREILGGRIGGIFSTGGLDATFGKGTEMELHFIEGLGSWYGIDFALSAHNFGKSLDSEKDFDYINEYRTVELELYSLTVGAVAMKDLPGRFSSSIEGGFGLYTISAVIPAGFYEGRITKNRLGLYTGLFLHYRLTSGGLALEFGGKYHHVFSGDDPEQVIFAYTGENQTDIFQITVGLTLYTK